MISLLDVNVLVAMLVPEHEHHVAAQDWFTTEAGTDGWATCVVTELGAIRVCAQLPGGSWPTPICASTAVFQRFLADPARQPSPSTTSTAWQATSDHPPS